MHSPAHPGSILRELYLKPLRITLAEAADALGVTPKHISGIVNGHARITADMAIRLAAALDTEAQLWVNLQAQHDLWVASQTPPENIKSLRQVA
jgi:addiction module HigA family antidote